MSIPMAKLIVADLIYKNHYDSSFAATSIVPIMTVNNTLLERTLLLMQTVKPKILSNCWNTKIMQEDTFCVNAFDLFANPFIGSIPDTTYHGSHYELPESRERKFKLAANMGLPTKNVRGRKPDRCVSISVDGQLYHVLLCEVKTEKASKDRGDLVKLGTMTKDCLDRILDNLYPRDILYVVGILQQGQSCTLYTLNSPFNYYYQMIEVFSCTTPSSSDDISRLHDTVLLFSYARFLADTAISILQQRENFLHDSHINTLSILFNKTFLLLSKVTLQNRITIS